MLSTSTWLVLLLAAAAIGISKTALPGGATLAVALFAAVMPAKESTGMMLIALLIGDLSAIWIYRRDADWLMLRRLIPGVLAGVALGAVFLHFASDQWVKIFIAVLLLILIGITLTLLRLPHPPQLQGRAGRAVYGTLAGFTTMVANAGGPVTTMYFLASRLNVTTFLGTTAWFFFLVNLAKLPLSLALGIIRPGAALVSLVLAPIVIIFAGIGWWLARHLNTKIFNALVTVLTIGSALYLLL